MLSVLKVGGSVLRDEASYAATAGFLKNRLAQDLDERLVVIVSAEYGATDALLAEAEAITPEPDNHALDLIWCTGELRSVARLALHLQRIGVSAIPFNVHQTGLVSDRISGTTVRPLTSGRDECPPQASAATLGDYSHERPADGKRRGRQGLKRRAQMSPTAIDLRQR